MNEVFAIFQREVVARRHHLLVAAAFMFTAVLMPFVPETGNYDPSEVRGVTSVFLALLLGCSVAVGLGISLFGKDLTAGRLGFFFARPVTARAIWVGRILAAFVIVLACEAVVILPALVEEGVQLFSINATGWLFIICAFILLPILLLLGSHALSVMGGARTAWLFLDLAALLVIGVGSWLTVRPFVLLGAVKAVALIAILLVGVAAIALASAGLVGTAVGRTDLRRTHGALSMTLWFLLGISVAGVSVYGGWLRDFGPTEMDDVRVVSVAPDGEWIEIWGTAPRRFDVYRHVLISTIDGRCVMLPISRSRHRTDLIFSTDGGTAVALGHVSGNSRLLSWVDLRADLPTLVETLLVVSWRTTASLSPDGTRVALLEDGTLSVYDLMTEQLVKAIRLPTSLRKATVLFHEHDRLRLYSRSGEDDASMIRIAEVDLEAGKVGETGRIEEIQGASWMAMNSSAERLILAVRKDRSATIMRSLYDSRDGSLIRELHDRDSMRFLKDGRLVTLSDTEVDGARLLVESADGTTRIEHPLGRADWEGLGGEALPGQVVIGHVQELDEGTQGRRYDLVDVESGEIRPIADGLRRTHTGFQRVGGGGGTIFWYVDTPEANRIFTDRTGAVVRWDPESGELIHIVGGSE